MVPISFILSDEQIRHLFDATKDLIQSVALDGKIIYVNQAWLDTLGYTIEEVKVMNIFDVIHRDHHSACQGFLQCIAGDKRSGRIEVPFITKDQHTVLVEGQVTMHFENDQPIATRGIFRDITKRKKSESAMLTRNNELEQMVAERTKELYASEKRYKEIDDCMPGAVFEFCIDTFGKRSFQFIGQGINNLIGYSSSDCMNDAEIFFRQIPADTLPKFEASIQTSLNQMSPWLQEFQVKTPMGEKWLCGHSIPHRKNNGDTHWHGVFVEITENKKAEEALRQSEQLFRTLAQIVPVGIFQADKNGLYHYVNERFCEIANVSKNEACGVGWLVNIHPKDRERIDLEWQYAVNNRESFVSEYRILTAENKIRWVVNQADIKMDESGNVLGYVGIVSDITDRKKKENSLRTLNERSDFLFSSAPAIIYTCESVAPYRATFISANVINILGYTSKEFLDDPNFWVNHIHPEDRDQVLDSFSDVFSQGKYTHEYRFQHQNGRWLWMRDELNIIVNPADETHELIGYFIDITEQRQKDIALESAHSLLRTVIDTVPARIFWKNRALRYLGCNTVFAKDSGMASPEDLIGKDDFQLGWNDQAEIYQRDDLSVITSGVPKLSYEEPQTTPDGQQCWLRTSKVPLRNKYEEIIGVLGIYEDITEQKKAYESMLLANTIYESSNEAIIITDENNRIIQVNPAFKRMTGFDAEDVIGKNPKIFQSGRHGKSFYQNLWSELLQKDHWQGEVWDRKKDGSIHAKWLSISIIRHPDGSVKFHVAQFSDITEKKQKDALIVKQANYDPLTHLPNRNLFKDRLLQDMKRTLRSNQTLALLFLDLDHFKDINDTFGHDRGDELLNEVGSRVLNCVRDTDTVARLGGDEFAVILSDVEDEIHVGNIAQNIIQALNSPFKLFNDPVEYHVSTSIGIVFYPRDGADLESLMKHADQAMYAAKEERNRFSFFTHALQKIAIERMVLMHDLRQAVKNQELMIHFQPIIDLSNGRIAKTEALLRWKHPRLGMVSPSSFIPLAEHSGLIIEIAEQVLNQSIGLIKQWQKQTDQTLQVSINMSPVQFKQRGKSIFEELISQSGLPGHCINVEITEGLLLKDSPVVKERLMEFRNQGIEVSIDDFGTGFSSLSYLKRFDIDYLKIDQSFVKQLTENDTDRALVEAIIVMAHKLDIKTIAEGVETKEQEQLLMRFGCDYAQGFLYSVPIPANELIQFVRQYESSET